MAAGYCSVCRRNTRAGHYSTAAHRTATVRAEKAAGNRVVGKTGRRARLAAGARQARRSLDEHYKATLLRIRTYKRSRPNDGARKVVKVSRHYRRPAESRVYVTHKLQTVAGKVYRVRYADGKATSMRPATRAERSAG